MTNAVRKLIWYRHICWHEKNLKQAKFNKVLLNIGIIVCKDENFKKGHYIIFLEV